MELCGILTRSGVRQKLAQRGASPPKRGGYRKLRSFQIAQLVYDVTLRFCDHYINK